MKKGFKLIALICGLWTMGYGLVSAQPPPPPPPGPLSGTDAPLDKEVVFLLLAAAVFGAYKLKGKASSQV